MRTLNLKYQARSINRESSSHVIFSVQMFTFSYLLFETRQRQIKSLHVFLAPLNNDVKDRLSLHEDHTCVVLRQYVIVKTLRTTQSSILQTKTSPKKVIPCTSVSTSMNRRSLQY